MGLGAYFGHFLGHWLSGTAMMYASTGDAAVQVRSALSSLTNCSLIRGWLLFEVSTCALSSLADCPTRSEHGTQAKAADVVNTLAACQQAWGAKCVYTLG